MLPELDASCRPTQTLHGLPVYSLYDVLSRVPLPPNCPLSGVSKKWRCVIAPRVDEGPSNAADSLPFNDPQALYYLDKGIPCLLGRNRSEEVHEASGPDAFKFLFDTRWNQFPKPKIAFRAGWAGPGTSMESANYHHLVHSFRDVVEHGQCGESQLGAAPAEGAAPLPSKHVVAGEAGDPAGEPSVGAESKGAEQDPEDDHEAKPEDILNLQLFHRPDASTCPQLPVLSEKLIWPGFLEDGAVCDNATRVSQRGAVTWWHLDDSGEFVMQTCLPLRSSDTHVFPLPLDRSFFDVGAAALLERLGGGNCTAPSPVTALEPAPSATDTHARERAYFAAIDEALSAPHESANAVPGKLFIYGPRQSYDWFMHDDESTVTGKIAALNIFGTPDEALPEDETLLPIVTVAVLEAGGRPLISPPNIPHIVITVNCCVMVEQRRVAHLFLEEISYFLQKCAFWAETPIIYDYVEKDLRAEGYIAGQLVPMLMESFQRYSAHSPHEQIMRRRIVMALYTIAMHEKHYALAEDSRRSLLATVTRDNEDMAAILRATDAHYGPERGLSLQEQLDEYWNVQRFWPKRGCVFEISLLAPLHLLSAAVRSGAKLKVTARATRWYAPVVYAKASPVYGREKHAVEDTATEYNAMRALCTKANGEDATADLFKFLRNAKHRVKDDLLDELF